MNREKIKHIISINLVLIIILSIMNISSKCMATISEYHSNGNIEVSNIERGVEVSLYQIAYIEYDYTANQPKEGFKWTDDVQTWINKYMPEYSDPKEFYNKTNNDEEKTREFYDKLAASIRDRSSSLYIYRGQTAEGEASYPLEEDNLNGRVDFENVAMGSYLVIIENGYMVYMPSVVNLTPIYNTEKETWELQDQQVVIKASKPSITKNVTDENKIKDNYSLLDEISYTINADIPTYLDSSLSKKYSLSDKIDKSLLLKNDSIKIYGGKDGEETQLTTGYTLNFNAKRINDEEVTFLVDFDYNQINQYDYIKIKYQASLVQNNQLVVGATGNNNYAYLDYSNNPYSKTSIQTQESGKVTVFTYGIEIKSVDQEDENNILEGSEFNISDENGEILHFKKGEDGEYYLADSDDEDTLANLVVNKEGKINIKGLDEGIYSVKQVKAPNGYQISKNEYKLNLEDKDLDGELDEAYNLIFKNTKGFTLPVTGGKGIVALVSISVVLIGIGVSLIISISKKKKILNK